MESKTFFCTVVTLRESDESKKTGRRSLGGRGRVLEDNWIRRKEAGEGSEEERDHGVGVHVEYIGVWLSHQFQCIYLQAAQW